MIWVSLGAFGFTVMLVSLHTVFQEFDLEWKEMRGMFGMEEVGKTRQRSHEAHLEESNSMLETRGSLTQQRRWGSVFRDRHELSKGWENVWCWGVLKDGLLGSQGASAGCWSLSLRWPEEAHSEGPLWNIPEKTLRLPKSQRKPDLGQEAWVRS